MTENKIYVNGINDFRLNYSTAYLNVKGILVEFLVCSEKYGKPIVIYGIIIVIQPYLFARSTSL